MSGRRLQSAFRLLVSSAALVAIAFGVHAAHAEETIIKRPGDHPTYSVEIGGRFTIPIVKNGFVSSINNSVGIGFGLDWVHYNGCYRYFGNPNDCSNFDAFVLPVVMQWNFFLSTHWSVFGEPGLAIVYNNWGSCGGYYVDSRNNRVLYECGNAPSRIDLNPFVLFVGGRYHFSETTALTMRIGWPYFSIGVSFMP